MVGDRRASILLAVLASLAVLACGCQALAAYPDDGGESASAEYLGWTEDVSDATRTSRLAMDDLLGEPRQDASWRAGVGEIVVTWHQLYREGLARQAPARFARGHQMLLDGLNAYSTGGDLISQGLDDGDNRLLLRGLADADYGDQLIQRAMVALRQESGS